MCWNVAPRRPRSSSRLGHSILLGIFWPIATAHAHAHASLYRCAVTLPAWMCSAPSLDGGRSHAEGHPACCISLSGRLHPRRRARRSCGRTPSRATSPARRARSSTQSTSPASARSAARCGSQSGDAYEPYAMSKAINEQCYE